MSDQTLVPEVNMRIPVLDQPFFALFPPYREVDPIPHPSGFPSVPLPPRGAALLWNLEAGDWGRGFRAVRDRPPGVALFILLPPTSRLGGLDRLLELMEYCRPHSILPHMDELIPDELVTFLRRFPADFPLEVADYLTWRGIEVDTDTRRLIRKTLQLSEELRTVAGLARSLYLSRRALGRRFMTRGLPPPSRWLHFGRILRASVRLQNPDSTLFSVAGELGYPDGFSLSNQMYRLIRLRPSIMRDCFGWEWIVESWLHQEAGSGNLSPNLQDHLFPPTGENDLRCSPKYDAPSGPQERLSVAENAQPARLVGGSGGSG
jgi:AraC-like DNA-binding protein